MDQAEELRNVIKKQNQRTKKPARIITVTRDVYKRQHFWCLGLQMFHRLNIPGL